MKNRILWIIAGLWLLAHLGLYIYLVYNPARASGSLNPYVGGDSITYRLAAEQWLQRAPLYEEGQWSRSVDPSYQPVDNWRYHPLAAVFFVPMTWLNEQLFVALWLCLMTVVYVAGVFVWWRTSNSTFPVYLALALVSTDMTGALLFGNISLALVALSGVSIYLALQKRFTACAFLICLMAFLKPQWVLPVLAVLFIRYNWQTLFRTLVITGIFYVALTALYVLVSGVSYGIDTLSAYARFVTSIYNNYPWQGSEVMFNTLQNSIYQTLLRYGLSQSVAKPILYIIQFALAGWGGILLLKARRNKSVDSAIAMAMVAYLVGMLLLPQLEELVLSAVIFVFLLMRTPRWWLWIYAIHLFSEVFSLIGITTQIDGLRINFVLPTLLIGAITLLIGLSHYLLRHASEVAEEAVQDNSTSLTLISQGK